MSHHMYHTRGIILTSSPQGEASKFYKILTEDLGLIGATAQGVREGKSKLKHALQDFSVAGLDLVQGKGGVWRITNARYEPLFEATLADPHQYTLVARIAGVLVRFVHGEAADADLFRIVLRLYAFLREKTFSDTHWETLEVFVVLQILTHLGYVDDSVFEGIARTDELSQKTLLQFEPLQKHAIIAINKAFRESHL